MEFVLFIRASNASPFPFCAGFWNSLPFLEIYKCKLIVDIEYMPDQHFTDGNLIILYGIYRYKHTDGEYDELPLYIKERIKVCLATLKIIIQSKPDKDKTIIVVIANPKTADSIKTELVKEGIDPATVTIDSIPKNMAQTFDHIVEIIKTRINPPHIYFVGSFWLRDIYDYMVSSKLKGYKVQFEGSPDNRSIDEVQEDKKLDTPKKGIEHYKKEVKDKAIDMLLSYIFRENNKQRP